VGLREVVYQLGKRNPRVQAMKLAVYAEQIGWIRSRFEGAPVHRDGTPRAWLVYPMLELLEERVEALRVFEWGSGGSTRWWRALGCEVVSCEHNAAWAAKQPGVVHRPLDTGYVEEIRAHGAFDLVLVDGRRRVECLAEAVRRLTPRGVIVLDNCDRDRYRAGVDATMAAGFRFLSLHGLAPGMTKDQATGVFYRDGNCLGL
jgi:hypothetical protein